jgi:hypothetical protein
MQGTIPNVSKGVSMIKYEDLLISSKFFYKEGSEESSLLFPDETKEIPSNQRARKAAGVDVQPETQCCSDAALDSRNASMDIDVAMEAACGDATFLVVKYIAPRISVRTDFWSPGRAGGCGLRFRKRYCKTNTVIMPLGSLQ